MSELPNPEVAILNAALELRTDLRAAYLDTACAGDAALRQQVEALLHAHDQAEGFLETRPAGLDFKRTVRVNTPLTESPGDKIDRYKLLQQIGEGGCGVVYMAEQEKPVRRRVALKVIKLGMDTKNVIARFEAERQALAMMDHPNIAKVLDAGATDAGRPYFVMELVRGVPITKYCDESNLTTRDRLDLFITVCLAIQHAHQKGIIHRDIKPSNILVTINDGVAVPKVIDFGIAKATEGRLTDKTLFTQFEALIGTPAYMSPEQAVMTSLDIDTRSDIYSLGVLLYEILTGKTPFDAKELMAAGLDEMRRTIREQEPARPSTRLSTMLVGELTTTAKHRQADAPKLINLLRGDLDWIVMKCLEKDRQRRYETANGLASDIQRHLSSEPVVARPPSAGYRFQKFTRRNKGVFAAITAVVAALVLGVVISAWQAIRATKAERQQRTLRQAAVKAQNGEAKQRALAEQRVYDSLVREARALRLARRVGYRDEVFSVLRQAVALKGVEKNADELRREAVACLGDFVGNTPVAYSNFMSGFRMTAARFHSSGSLAAFRFNNHEQRKDALILRTVPGGEELARVVTDKSIVSMDFVGPGQFATILIPSRDTEKERRERHANAEVIVWAAGRSGAWNEVSREPVPGAYDLVAAARPMIAVDDWSVGLVRLIDLEGRAARIQIAASKAMKWPPTIVLASSGKFLACQTATQPDDKKSETVLWDLELGREVRAIPLGNGEEAAGISSDGRHLTVQMWDANRLAVYDLETMKALAQIPDVMLLGIKGPGWMPQRSVLAIPSILQHGVRLFDYARQEEIALLDGPTATCEAIFSANGRWMLTAGNHNARVYDLDSGKEMLRLNGHSSGAAAAFQPRLNRIATTGFEDGLCIWNAENGDLILRTNIPPWETIRSSPDGQLLIVSSYGTQEVFLQDAETGEHLLTLGTNAPGGVQSAVISSDNRYLVAASRNTVEVIGLLTDFPNLGSVSVWELHHSSGPNKALTATLLRTLVGKFNSFAFLPVSTKVAFCDLDLSPAAYVWDIASTNAPRKLNAKLRWDYQNLVPTLDGRGLWIVDSQGNVVCIEIETGNRLATLTESSERFDFVGPGNISLSPDGSKLAVPSFTDFSVEIFDTVAGRSLYSLPSRAGSPWNTSWSADSQRLAIARSNGDVAIWNLVEVERTLAGLGLARSGSPAKPINTPTQR